MDPYTFGLTLGSVGLGVMALSGFAQAAHAGHAHTHGHAGHGHTHGGHGHGHTHVVPHGTHAVRAHASSRLLALLSPRLAFSVLVGFGATGLLLRPVLGEPALFAASLGGGVAFEWLVVSPLWRFLFRFASAPAQTLDSCVSDEARAVTGFDAAGHGLVAVELDGQVVQLLATMNFRTIADATAESIRKVNDAIVAGGESYFRYKQIELLPQLGPAIAKALSQAKLVTIASGGENAPQATTSNITSVIQTVLAAQLVGRAGVLDGNAPPALPGPAR
jgi:hypothetical protein